MNIWRRAYLHTVRKKGKTVLMFLIFLIMSTMILTCLSIQSAGDTAALNIRKSLMGGFSVNATHTDNLLEASVAAEILKLPGVVNNYNLRSYYRAEYRAQDGTKLEIKKDGVAEPLAGDEHTGKIVAATYSEQETYFIESGFKLVGGRHIDESDRNVILISDDFAERNSLKLGDELLLCDNDLDKQIRVKIIGIFKPPETMDTNEMTAPESLYENIGFTDQTSYSRLYFDDGKLHGQYGDFQADDPAKLDAIVNQVKNIAGMDWQRSRITKEDADYQNAKLQLEALQNLTLSIVAILIVISIVLLAVILLLWTRNRIPEIGMLLAMGIGKVNIFLQQLAELLMIAVLSFGLSFAASSLIAQNIGDTMFEQASVENHLTNTLESIHITVSLSDLLLVYGIGTTIIFIAITLASYPIMRLAPKKILTKLS